MFLAIAKGFIYFLLVAVLVLIVLNLIYSRSEKKQNKRVSSDRTYRSTSKLMKDNSNASGFTPILHYDEAKFKKGGKGNGL